MFGDSEGIVKQLQCISDGPLSKQILENALVLQNVEVLDVSLPKK